jgi:hypothetical protein
MGGARLVGSRIEAVAERFNSAMVTAASASRLVEPEEQFPVARWLNCRDK